MGLKNNRKRKSFVAFFVRKIKNDENQNIPKLIKLCEKYYLSFRTSSSSGNQVDGLPLALQSRQRRQQRKSAGEVSRARQQEKKAG